jgi:5-methylcytosine-specific restriction endonuclease McrA
MGSYTSKLRDRRWQKRRLEIMQRDRFTCQLCGSVDPAKQLHVHHLYYTRGVEPWEYPDDALISLCESCHKIESRTRPSAFEDFLSVVSRISAPELRKFAANLRRLRDCDPTLIEGQAMLLREALRR